MRHLLPSLLLVAVQAATPLAAQPAVPFKFAWRPGTRAEISITMRQAAPLDTTPRQSMSTMAVAPDPRGLRIDQSSPSSGLLPQVPGAMLDSAALARVAAASAFVVTANGEFLGIADTAALRTALEGMMAALRAQVAGNAAMARVLDSAASMSRLVDGARQNWRLQSAVLLDGNWRVGRERVDTIDFPFPAGPGSRLRIAATTKLVALEPCEPGAAAQCARLTRSAPVSAEVFAKAMAGMMREMMGGEVSAEMLSSLPSMSLTNDTEFVVEVATLLPRRVALAVRQTSQTFTGDKTSSGMQTTATYRYVSR